MASDRHDVAHQILATMWDALEGDKSLLDKAEFTGQKILKSPFAHSDFMGAAFASAGLAVSELLTRVVDVAPKVYVNRANGSYPSGAGSVSLAPRSQAAGMGGPSAEYATADGRWLRAGTYSGRSADHLLFPNARKGNMVGLGFSPDQDPHAPEVAEYCLKHNADELEAACLAAGGAAAASRSIDEWRQHPAGKAIIDEPIVDIQRRESAEFDWRPTPGRPLSGLRVIDMTRVLAGPIATRLFAGLGAEVLRIDRPGYEIAAPVSGGDLMLGKRCTCIDLKSKDGRDHFLELLADADVFIHGYRPDALDKLGIGADVCAEVSPGLVEVMHNTYGWAGPWNGRRGFEWAVQFSSGITTACAEWMGDPRPSFENDHGAILDCATGYLDAAAAIRGLTHRIDTGQGSLSRLSLARDAMVLVDGGAPEDETFIESPFTPEGELSERVYSTSTGPVRRYAFPLHIEGSPVEFDRPGDPWGSASPVWVTNPNVGRVR